MPTQLSVGSSPNEKSQSVEASTLSERLEPSSSVTVPVTHAILWTAPSQPSSAAPPSAAKLVRRKPPWRAASAPTPPPCVASSRPPNRYTSTLPDSTPQGGVGPVAAARTRGRSAGGGPTLSPSLRRA